MEARKSAARILFFLAALVALLPQSSLAGTCGTGLNTIVVTTTSVVFGNYSAGSPGATTANGTVAVSCLVPVGNVLPSFAVALSAGAVANFNPRGMSFGAARLNYNLYTTPSFATIWGDGTSGTSVQNYSASQSLALASYTVYGAIPTGQFVATGMYADTIVVTVTY